MRRHLEHTGRLLARTLHRAPLEAPGRLTERPESRSDRGMGQPENPHHHQLGLPADGPRSPARETRVKVLLLENIHTVAAETFRRNGFEVELRSGSLSEAELVRGPAGRVRARDPVQHQGHRGASWMRPPTCAPSAASASGPTRSTSTDATERGVAVFNAPFSNTRSVVELVLGEILALARRLPEKTQRMHDGIWDKSAKGSHEIRGRTLGIVGYGNIGTQLSNVAEAIGMRVVFFDTADRLAHGNARPRGLARRAARAVRRRQHPRRRPAGERRPVRARAVRADEAGLGVHQRLARDGRGRRGAARAHPVRAPVRCGDRRLPDRAQGAGRPVRVPAARTRQRDPHPARRRVDPGGPGGDRARSWRPSCSGS